VNYTYDKIGQLKTARGYESDGLTLRLQEQFGYAYDKGWNLNYRTNNDLTETFAANAANELTRISRTNTMMVGGSVGSTYGPISVTASGTGLSSGAANVYADGTWARAGASPVSGQNSYTATATDGYSRSSQDSVTVTLLGTNSYTYDANGNLLSDGQRTFAYDDENQLSSVTVSNAWRSEFVYDGMLRRRKRLEYTWSGGAWLKTNEVRYVYDGRVVVQERDASNLPLVSYTRGNYVSGGPKDAGGIGRLLARTDSPLLALGSSLAHAYYHCDGNGNVTCLINASNAIVGRYTYDPFGSVLSMSGPLAGANLYRFSSKEVHPNSGLVYYLYRYYDPNLQRWLSRDPIQEQGGLNLYRYVANRPLNFVDRFGLCGGGGEEDTRPEEDFFDLFRTKEDLEKEEREREDAWRYPGLHREASIGNPHEEPSFQELLDDVENDPLFTSDLTGEAASRHGGAEHWRAIRDEVDRMERAGYGNIEVNKQQKDAAGNVVGNNRPDVAGVNPKTGQRENVEFDHSPTSSYNHFKELQKNDPNAKNDCRMLP